ncbi:MAG: thiolase domain-containing protein [Anaerolineaceae bacterium]|nr:thiolase domain-containing protein [Anaerolineaceae bacterium]
MTEVAIAGIGQTPVGEHWDVSLHTLAARAIQAARKDCPDLAPQAMYIGNFLASTASHQANLGSLLAESVALEGIEGVTVEAAEASGAGAFHLAYLAIASGLVNVALVVGVEKYTDVVGPRVDALVAEGADYDYETVNGMTPAAQAGLLMQRYLYEYGVPRSVFGEFPILAHANAVNNPHAMYRKPIRRETYDNASPVSSPLNMLDVAPYADGAAALLLTRSDQLPRDHPHPLVRVTGSSVVTDRLSLHDRTDLLAFEAAKISIERACRQAGILPEDASLFEVWDGFSIYAILSLEAAGLAKPGEGWKAAQEGALGGRLPLLTMGGQKARGNPLGASGVYQLVEATQQLRGEAGKNQVSGARRALVQALGGPASTAITHVLERWQS